MALSGYDPTPDRALLEPRSTSAQLDAVEALARQVEYVLSRRSTQQQPIRLLLEEEEEFTADLAGLSQSSSLSPVQSEPTVQSVFQKKHQSPSAEMKRKKTALKQAKSLDAYQKYPTATSSWRRGSLGAITTEKYRLSFVDLSDSSSEEEDGVCLKTDSSGAYCSESIKINGVASKKEPNLGKTDPEVKNDEVVGNEEKTCTESENTELESVQNLSIGQFSDLHYDDEEIAQSTHNHSPNTHHYTTSCDNMPPTHVFSHHHTRNRTHQHSKTLETTGLMYEDEDFDLVKPPFKNTPTKLKTDSKAPHISSLINSPAKVCTGTDSRSVITARENTNTGTDVQMRHHSVTCMDHASFSPLYAMSVTQLQYTVRLLETKLQGNHHAYSHESTAELWHQYYTTYIHGTCGIRCSICAIIIMLNHVTFQSYDYHSWSLPVYTVSSSTLIRLLQEKDSLTAENSALHENISRISRYVYVQIRYHVGHATVEPLQ